VCLGSDRPAFVAALRGGGCTARDEHALADLAAGGIRLPEGTPENYPNRRVAASTVGADNVHTPEDSPLGLEVQDNG
jgi:hypothetical protein